MESKVGNGFLTNSTYLTQIADKIDHDKNAKLTSLKLFEF